MSFVEEDMQKRATISLIKRTIIEATVSDTTNQSLQNSAVNYFLRRDTTEIALNALFERAGKVSKHFSRVFLRCLRILKIAVMKMYLDDQLLATIHSFCEKHLETSRGLRLSTGGGATAQQSLQQECVKSLNFVLAFVRTKIDSSSGVLENEGGRQRAESAAVVAENQEKKRRGRLARLSLQAGDNTYNETSTKSRYMIGRSLLRKNLSSAKLEMKSSQSLDNLSGVPQSFIASSPMASSSPTWSVAEVKDAIFFRPVPTELRKYEIKPTILQRSLFFGGQFRCKPVDENEPTEVPFDLIDSVKCWRSDSLLEIAEVVAKVKKREENEHYRETGSLQKMKRGVSLFHYKYYKDQLPLRLRDGEMDDVMQGLKKVSPNGRSAEMDLAAKICIKLLMDMYKMDPPSKWNSTLLLFLDLLASPEMEVKALAFELLFNLSLHSHLFEDPDKEVEPELKFRTVRAKSIQKGSQGDLIQSDLLSKLAQMTTYILEELSLQHEANRNPSFGGSSGNGSHYYQSQLLAEKGLWTLILNCILYFVCEEGKVIFERAARIDVRVWFHILDVLEFVMLPAVREEIVAVVVAMLYGMNRNTDGSNSSKASTPRSVAFSGFPPSPSSAGLKGKGGSRGEKEKKSKGSSWKDLDVDLLEEIGGIDIIIRMYIRERSVRSLTNLFTIIFDFAVLTYDAAAKDWERGAGGRGSDMKSHFRRRSTPLFGGSTSTSGGQSSGGDFGSLSGRSAKPNKPVDDRQVSYIFELFIALRAPEAFRDLFMYVPEKFVESFVKYVFFLQMEKHPKLKMLSEKMDKIFIVSFLHWFQSIAQEFWSLGPFSAEYDIFTSRLRDAANGKSVPAVITNQQYNLLSSLVHSRFERDRRIGESWLFSCLSTDQISTHSRKSEVSRSSPVEDAARRLWGLYYALANRPQSACRRMYISITHKLMLRRRSKFSSYGDKEAVHGLFHSLNEGFLRLVACKERNTGNLVYMSDVLLSFLTAFATSHTDGREVDELLRVVGKGLGLKSTTREELFLSRKVLCPLYLLREVDVHLLHYIFMWLSSSSHVLSASSLSFSLSANVAGGAAAVHVHSQSQPVNNLGPFGGGGSGVPAWSMDPFPFQQTQSDVTWSLASLRLALLILIVEKCKAKPDGEYEEKESPIDAVGGTKFFARLLQDRDPLVVSIVSEFLLERMMKTNEMEYMASLNRLIAKAQLKDDEELLKNPFLQVREMKQALRF
mmetsp:Transcript_18778/g.47596  ORF Transcript_18778/g.47596 Transcript_18778/m.47596 type:complete len:1223 (-) Transcript_18778:243-3911(-)